MPPDAENDDQPHRRLPGDPDSRRVGRMGSYVGRPRRIRVGTGRRPLSSSKGTTISAGSTVFGSFERRQQVVVKFYVSKHKPTASGSSPLTEHIKYLSRDGVGLDGKEPLFFDAQQSEIDPLQVNEKWHNDRHHFRVIISPERGKDIADMEGYVGQIMEEVARDLGTSLEWQSTIHYNTEHHHAHVVLRGKRDNGQDLVIDSTYISQGFRDRASQVATQWLGERTKSEIRQAIEKQIQAERWTQSDAILEKHQHDIGGRQVVDINGIRLHKRSHLTIKDIKSRLEYLQQLGLATPIQPAKRYARKFVPTRRWVLDPNIRSHLKDLGERNDIIKQLHRGMGDQAQREAGQVTRLNPKHSLSKESSAFRPATGRVIAYGRVHEISDEGFVIVRTVKNKLYQARVRYSELAGVERNSVVQLGRNRQWRHQLADDIAASLLDGVFTKEAFRGHLEKHVEAWKTKRLDSLTRNAQKMLERLSSQNRSGVTKQNDGHFVVNEKQFASYMKDASLIMDMRTLSQIPLDKQIAAKPYAYLDMHLMRITKQVTQGKQPKILDKGWAQFLTDRIQWLEERGIVVRPDREHPFAVAFKPTAISLKRNTEIEEIRDAYKKKLGKPVMLLGTGHTAMGKFVGAEQIHDGFVAIVEGNSRAYLVPADKAPPIKPGQLVDVEVRNRRQSHVQPSKIDLRRAIVDRTR